MSNKVINVGEIDVSGEAPEELKTETSSPELSPEELKRQQLISKLMMVRFTNSSLNWKGRLKGFPSHGKVKPVKFWYQGNLISKEEHDKLPLAEIFEDNNRITKASK